MINIWEELWKEEKYMTSEDVPTDFYNLMMKIKAEGDKLKKKYDHIIDLASTDYHDYSVDNLALRILEVADGIAVQDSTETPQ